VLPRPFAMALLAAVAVTATLASLESAEARRSPICTRGLTSVEVDPRGLLPLTGVNPVGAAAAAAARFVEPASRPQVVSATLATQDHERGPAAKFECGARVWRRTVVVYVTARAMLPSQSLSQGVFFVGRFRLGYRVWQVVR
jgi:hypothetical protein